MSETSEYISRNAAALILGVDPKTVTRWSNESPPRVARHAEGFLRSEVEELKEDLEPPPEGPQDALLKFFRETMDQANENAQKMLAMVVEPAQQFSRMTMETNAQLLAQNSDLHAELYKAREFEGDVLLNKEERDAVRAESAQKREMVSESMALLAKTAPHLIEQLTGADTSALRLIQSLNDEERAMVSGLHGFLEGDEKKAAFAAFLKSVGMEVPALETIEAGQ